MKQRLLEWVRQRLKDLRSISLGLQMQTAALSVAWYYSPEVVLCIAVRFDASRFELMPATLNHCINPCCTGFMTWSAHQPQIYCRIAPALLPCSLVPAPSATGTQWSSNANWCASLPSKQVITCSCASESCPFKRLHSASKASFSMVIEDTWFWEDDQFASRVFTLLVFSSNSFLISAIWACRTLLLEVNRAKARCWLPETLYYKFRNPACHAWYTPSGQDRIVIHISIWLIDCNSQAKWSG